LIVLGRETSYFVNKPHSDSTKKFSETDIIKRQVLLIGTIFVLFLDVFLTDRQWVQNVLLFSSTCSFIRTRQISYRCFSRKRKEASPI